MDILNNCAGIATLVLFIIYFIGRIITILSVRNIWKDKIVYQRGDSISDINNIVDEIGDVDNPNVYGAYLISQEGIRNLKVYEVEQQKTLYKKGKEIYSKDFLNINETINICYDIGEVIPPIIVEYLTTDYMKVTIEWVMNGKSGVASEMIHPKHTWKSFLYFLFR